MTEKLDSEECAADFDKFMEQFNFVDDEGQHCFDVREAAERYVQDHPDRAAAALSFFAWYYCTSSEEI